MSERLSLREPSGANPTWLAVPLVVFALITLTVGLVARQTVREPYATPFFHLFFTDTPPDEGVAGDSSDGAGMWSVADGRTHLRVAPLSTQGTLLSQCPSLVGTGGDRVYTSGGLPLCLPARIRYPQPTHLDSLAARVGSLRRRRRQGANASVDEVRALGAACGWKRLILNPSGAMADFRALVFYRRSRYHMSGTDGRFYLA